MVEVKSHIKKINGKTINVKSYARKEPILSASEYNLKNTRVKIVDKWDDAQNFEKNKKDLDKYVKALNQYAWVGIDENDIHYRYLSEKLSVAQDHEIMNHLSKDFSSTDLFVKPEIDPSQIVVMVDTDYLSSHKGNKISSESINILSNKNKFDTINDVLKSNKKLSSVPIFDLRDNKVVEGNHRVEVLKNLGYKSIPVHIDRWNG